MRSGSTMVFFLAGICLFFAGLIPGCAGKDIRSGEEGGPQEFRALDAAIEEARTAGKHAECPRQFIWVEGMKNRVHDLAGQGNAKDAVKTAIEASQMAATLCPPEPEPPVSRSEPSNLIEKQVIRLPFPVDSAAIRASDQAELDRVIPYFYRYHDAKIIIEGNTNNMWTEEKNHELSHMRAAAVKDYFVNVGGIDGSRIGTAGHGASKPLDSEDTLWGRYWNSRIEILIVPEF